jgi:hypothetical protein
VTGAGVGVGEETPDDVAFGRGLGGEVTQERGCHAVPGQDVVTGVADQGRGVIEAFDQVQDTRADLTARLGPGVRDGASQVMQIVAFGV